MKKSFGESDFNSENAPQPGILDFKDIFTDGNLSIQGYGALTIRKTVDYEWEVYDNHSEEIIDTYTDLKTALDKVDELSTSSLNVIYTG